MGCIDKKISELTPLAAPAINDLLVIVDVSVAGFETKNITVADFVTGGIVAPADAQYVTLALDADLTNERVLTGTANQVIVTDGGAGGPVTLSTPQDINVGSTPTFAGLTINGNITVTGTVDGIDIAGFAGASFVTIALSGFIANERVLTGTANQVIVTDGGAGGNVTLSLPQNIHLLATPQFDGMTLTGQLFIDGGADEIQIRVHADAVQTANIVTFEDSAGNVLSGIDERGIIFCDANTVSTNFFGGNNAGNATAAGGGNIALGDSALRLVSSGTGNVGIGDRTLYNLNTADDNFGMGYRAGYYLTSGLGNVYIGNSAGYYNQTGNRNICLGSSAGRGAAGNSNSYNVFIGYLSGNVITTGLYNIGIGALTLLSMTNAEKNTAIGYGSGLGLTTGDSNLFLGYYAGSRQTNLSNLLIIDNQQRANAAAEITDSILYGVMAAAPAGQTLRINAAVTVSQTPFTFSAATTVTTTAGDLTIAPATVEVFIEDILKLKERAAAVADDAGYGQLWVKNAAPCELWFTDDTGTDTQIV